MYSTIPPPFPLIASYGGGFGGGGGGLIKFFAKAPLAFRKLMQEKKIHCSE